MKAALLFLNPRFIPTRQVANALVPGRDRDDRQQGNDERDRGSDVPPVEDDAEILRVPGEEHL
ncbi:hypothetical protein NHQ30_010657 [Ciborinia camelliae]|nr:hypothetical protein NHQ30_010657 [Ciborinia camelliae]